LRIKVLLRGFGGLQLFEHGDEMRLLFLGVDVVGQPDRSSAHAHVVAQVILQGGAIYPGEIGQANTDLVVVGSGGGNWLLASGSA
jgi:hypothetical protein